MAEPKRVVKDGILVKERLWRPFIINLSLVVMVFLLGIFIGFVLRTNRIIHDQRIVTARAHFKNVVLTRRWNANYGGVYVKKVEGVISNPYLEDPDIVTADGIVYTMKNPALMTREISRYANEAGDFQYHITSLRPLNPDNAADEFETDALKRFENGEREVFETVSSEGHSQFRFMSPLFVEPGCMACHAKQGYSVGQVRGGISVSFDVTPVEKEMLRNKVIVSVLSVLTSLALLGIIFFLVRRLAGRLSDAYRLIETLSITDELTQLYNRRYFHARMGEEIARARRYGVPLSLILLDIDHFKKVNDQYGHQAGDAVLSAVAAILKSKTRAVDVVARYGGEEMVAILPETNDANAMIVAEKLRKSMESHGFAIPGDKTIRVTASFGLATLDDQPGTADAAAERLVKRADDALYTAKQQGRNRVVQAEVE